ncbi:MAG: YkgJ family cysteine cluster protein [Bdellovibrionaceae bacterium]|nr:YkgJ family cysteine cluster protein [Pseudobdellovibrionaceae bacterium]
MTRESKSGCPIKPKEQNPQNAGNFSRWLNDTLSNQKEDRGADVPCGDCTACCRSSQFIHIRPDETRTLKRIPKKLLFPAPSLPKGNFLMGYNDKGECPMFIENKCSIYSDRPRTCRVYDCRIFSATKIELDSEAQRSIRDQARRWKFEYPDKTDTALQAATLAAADFITKNRDSFSPEILPRHPAMLANLALKAHGIFLEEAGEMKVTPGNPIDVVNAILKILSDRE